MADRPLLASPREVAAAHDAAADLQCLPPFPFTPPSAPSSRIERSALAADASAATAPRETPPPTNARERDDTDDDRRRPPVDALAVESLHPARVFSNNTNPRFRRT